VAGEGQNPRRENLLNLADQADLKPKEAKAIIDQVRGAITGFKPLAARLNLSASTTARVVARLQEIAS
jgi:DNA-binding MarR family transcriptional regulator